MGGVGGEGCGGGARGVVARLTVGDETSAPGAPPSHRSISTGSRGSSRSFSYTKCARTILRSSPASNSAPSSLASLCAASLSTSPGGRPSPVGSPRLTCTANNAASSLGRRRGCRGRACSIERSESTRSRSPAPPVGPVGQAAVSADVERTTVTSGPL